MAQFTETAADDIHDFNGAKHCESNVTATFKHMRDVSKDYREVKQSPCIQIENKAKTLKAPEKIQPKLGPELKVTLVATSFDNQSKVKEVASAKKSARSRMASCNS